MLPSATPSLVEPLSEAANFTPRRIRHITGIQIRNLTPFPVRDSFTSALAQPVEQSYFNVSGTTDDLGTIVSRRRTRKSSTASNKTLHILNREDENFDVEINGEPRARRSSSSTITYPSSGQVLTSPSDTILSVSSSSRSSTFRRIRPRTSSMSSFGITQPSNAILHNTSVSVTTSSFLLPDNSQSVLKKVIDSRLIETFIAVFIPTHHLDAELENEQKLSRSAPASKSAFLPTTTRNKQISPTNRQQRTIASSSSRNGKTHISPPDSAPPSRTTFKTVRISNNISKVRQAPHGSATNSTSTILRPSSDSEPSPRLNKHVEGEASLGNEDLPAYFSPIHRPSTNPFFPIDARANFDLPHRMDTSGQRMKVEVWGKIGSPDSQDAGEAYLRGGWKVLDEWDFNLDSLVPLPVDVDTNSLSLPSNTLVLSLSPPGQSFYLPSSSSSRSSTPSAGYTSDPESAIRKANQVSENSDSSIPNEHGEVLPLPRRRHRSNLVDSASHSQARDATKTAGWQDLFKLVTLQSCIADNENSAHDVIQKIDDFLAEDVVFSLKRQISERELIIEDLKRDHNVVLAELQRKRQQITERKQKLIQRRTLLESAYDEIAHDSQLDKLIHAERDNSTFLYKKINSSRTTLLSTLSNIYPIELYSPPDLLYTILDVPLPIPVSLNDPAPPLSLPDHKEVTEEAIATALGYVAQVLQILAAYVGKKLIYPVTCIGSRSLIRDGISAMVGPRMFPLFSRGVDTYRFEYGVFLLNKDIEMLMSERDLRALDIRHTLPNLKNLMLTLSHDANATEERVQIRSSTAKIPDLETHSEEPRLEAEDLSTPKASRTLHFHTKTESTPPQSGSATPTTITDESRKQKSFLGFVPFSDYLWTRNLSTSQSVGDESSRQDSEHSNDAASLIDHDEDDRKTIQGVTSGEVHALAPELDS